MAIYGYHRTSTTEQHLDRGIKEITDFCKRHNYKLEKIYTDQQTGKNFNRPRYIVLRDDILRSGDTLIITEVDRLGRNKKNTVEELRLLSNRNIRVMILEIPTTLQDVSKMDNGMAKMILETVNHTSLQRISTRNTVIIILFSVRLIMWSIKNIMTASALIVILENCQMNFAENMDCRLLFRQGKKA